MHLLKDLLVYMGLGCIAFAATAAIEDTRLANPCPAARPCTISTNVPYDATGDPDSRPGTWGSASAYTVPIAFTDVPPGHRVRILRLYGDVIAWPHGQIPEGKFAGILAGITDSAPDQSPHVTEGLGSKGCFFYVQDRVGADGTRTPIDLSHIQNGLLGSDHKLYLKQAVYLNETGRSIHMETTLAIDFQYERAN